MIDEESEGMERRNFPASSSDRNDDRGQDQENPLLALSRFSKALAKHYIALSFIFGCIGSMLVGYFKATDRVKKNAQEQKEEYSKMIDVKILTATQVPFDRLEEARKQIEKMDERLTNVEKAQPDISTGSKKVRR